MIEMSHSQIEQRRSCSKQWHFNKADGLIGIPSMAALRGNRYHEAIQEKIEDGSFEHENKSVQFALDFALTLGGIIESEQYTQKIEGDVRVRGYIDVYAEDMGTNADDDVEIRTVADWKFPTKKPGRVPRTGYIRQLNLYAYLTGADRCAVVYPEYEKVFEFDADRKKGEKYFEDIVAEGVKILENNELEVSGFDVKGTPSPLCDYCEFRAFCPDRLGGRK